MMASRRVIHRDLAPGDGCQFRGPEHEGRVAIDVEHRLVHERDGRQIRLTCREEIGSEEGLLDMARGLPGVRRRDHQPVHDVPHAGKCRRMVAGGQALPGRQGEHGERQRKEPYAPGRTAPARRSGRSRRMYRADYVVHLVPPLGSVPLIHVKRPAQASTEEVGPDSCTWTGSPPA